MHTGRHLVATGLVVIFAALLFQLVSMSLSGLAVGVILVISGFLVMIARSRSESTTS